MEKRKNYTFIVASSICMLLLLIVIVGNFGGKGTRAEWKIDQDFCMGEYNVLVQESYCCKYEEEIIENHPHICSASTVDNDIYEYEGTYYLAKGKSKLVGDLDKCNYSMICIKPGEAVPMETCSTENLTECNSDTTCTDKGGVWENNQCHKKQSSNTGTEEEFNCPKGSSYLQYNGMFGSKNYCCDNNEISYNIPYPNICADYVKFTLVNDNDYVLEKNGCNVKIKRCINELYLDECKNGELDSCFNSSSCKAAGGIYYDDDDFSATPECLASHLKFNENSGSSCTVELIGLPATVVAGESITAKIQVNGDNNNEHKYFKLYISGTAYGGNRVRVIKNENLNINTSSKTGTIEISAIALKEDGTTECHGITRQVEVVQKSNTGTTGGSNTGTTGGSNTGTTGGSSDNACTGGSELIDNYCCEKGVHYYYMGKEKDCQDARDYKSQKKALNGYVVFNVFPNDYVPEGNNIESDVYGTTRENAVCVLATYINCKEQKSGNLEQTEPTCSQENLNECKTNTTCIDKGGVWENNQCHKKQSSNTNTTGGSNTGTIGGSNTKTTEGSNTGTKPTGNNSGNPTNNQRTGSTLMFVVFSIGIAMIVYTFWYFKSIREN